MLSAKKIPGCWPFFWGPCQHQGWYGSAVGEKKESDGEHTSGHVLSLSSAGLSSSLKLFCSRDLVVARGRWIRGRFYARLLPSCQTGKKLCFASLSFHAAAGRFSSLCAQVVPQQTKPDRSGCVSAKVCAWVGAELRPSEIVVDSWET